MSLSVAQGVPTLFFRREAYERAGLTRVALDTRDRALAVPGVVEIDITITDCVLHKAPCRIGAR